MANTVSIISYANTFGDLVTTLNAVSKENNDLAANNYIKPTGTLYLNEPTLGLQVANNAVVQGGLQVQGIGSYGYIQNNLRVDQQVYFTNTTLGLTNSGQANIGGPLLALATANSIIASNNITVGGNTFAVGSIFGANNLTIAGSTRLIGTTLINGTTTVANSLSVSGDTGVAGTTRSDKFVANTSATVPNLYVTGFLDAGTVLSQLNIVTANNLTTDFGYINHLQANSGINTSSLTASTINTSKLDTATANVSTTFNAASANGFINNLQVGSQLSVQGNFVINGDTVFNSNTFTINSGSSVGQISSYTVNRGTANAELRWNEPLSYWDINDVSTGDFHRILTTQQLEGSLTSTSTTNPISAAAANTLNTRITNANVAMQSLTGTSGSYANAAFSTANAAFAAANNVIPQIIPAWNTANASYIRANTSVNTITGTNGQVSPTDGAISLLSNNGIQIVAAANTFYVNNPQDVRTTASPTFAGLTLSSALGITQGGTGGTSSSQALQNLLPSTIGVPNGYVLGTSGGSGASYSWVAGGTGGGGGSATPGTTVTTNRLSYTASTNQTTFTTPTYVTGSGQLRVYVNGVRQYTSDYTESSTTSVTMNSGLNSGDTVFIEVDAYTTYAYYANNITITTPYGSIDSSANTIEQAIYSIESKKAPLAAPTFTGIPTSTTAPLGTSNTWIATTAFVNNQLNAGTTTTYSMSISGNAGTVNNGLYSNQVYTDPSWITISKGKVGLGSVDNTADANKRVNSAKFADTANTIAGSSVTGAVASATYATTAGSVSGSVSYATSAGSATNATNATNDSNGYKIVSVSSGTQTIAGDKTFTGNMSIGGPGKYMYVSGLANFTTAFAGASFGQATPNGTYAAYVQPNPSGGQGLACQNYNVNPGLLAFSSSTGSALQAFHYGNLNTSTLVGTITTNGSGVSLNTASDYRLKQNIVPLTDAVIRLKQLKPRNFIWKNNTDLGNVDGFIAHELQNVVPQAVQGEKDGVDENGKPKYQSIDTNMLVPLLTAALQEALARIEVLESKIK